MPREFFDTDTTTEPVRVMLCDDSAVQRGIMARILESVPASGLFIAQLMGRQRFPHWQ